MRLLICGDRKWNNHRVIYDNLKLRQDSITAVIEGEAKGADTIARVSAEDLGIPVLRFPAQWERYGKAAGPLRNQQMLREGLPDLVWAFHDNLDASKGTQHMVELALSKGYCVYIFNSKGAYEFLDPNPPTEEVI